MAKGCFVSLADFTTMPDLFFVGERPAVIDAGVSRP